jgi:tRNA G18 (ribose-2'-O)-methylase SpoU
VRGYFGVGVEGLSKVMNAGNLFRSAHAFGASFVFTIASDPKIRTSPGDTSHTQDNLPWYSYSSVSELALPHGCQIVGCELLDEAIDLPSFRHPLKAAYVFGPERGSLSKELIARCDHLVKIPTSFCINVATAAAIVLYDRTISLGRFAERPVSALAKPVPPMPHVHGGPRFRRRRND